MGIREAKAQLTRLIAKVRAGMVIDITCRGKEVAQIVPYPQHEVGREQVLQSLAERGWITPARSTAPRSYSAVPLKKPRDLQALLRRDRDKF